MSRNRLVLASSNAGKRRELKALLADVSIEVVSLDEAGPVQFPEEGEEYLANAVEKARAAANQLGCWAIADDSGLEVEGLGGAPGPLSARYGGPGLDDAARAAYLLEALALRSNASRKARFVCVAALVSPEGQVKSARGECRGRILVAPKGIHGFGYDPIFEPDGFSVSMAELSSSEKDLLSHRGVALAALRPEIVKMQNQGDDGG